MRRAMLLSGAFHVVVLTAILVGMPNRPIDLPAESAISVDIVTEPTPLAKAPAPDAAEAAPLPKREAASPMPKPVAPVPLKPEPPKAAEPETQTAKAEPPEATPAPPPPAPQQLSAPSEPPRTPSPSPSPAPVKPVETPPPPPPPTATPKVAEPLPTPLEAPAAKPDQPKPVEQAATEPPQPAPAARSKPPEVAKSQPPKVEQTREAPPQVPAPAPAPKPHRTETAQKAEPKKAPPKVEAKVEPEKKPPSPEDTFAALLKSVEQMSKRVQSPTTRSGKGSAEAPGAAPGSSRDAGLSPSAVNAIVVQASRQMADCWKIQAGLPGIDKIQPFDVDVDFNPDGTAAHVQIVDKARLASDPLFRVVAESAQRAAWSCRLSLPRASYAIWRSITFNFDPKTAVTG
jgi:hypothetical protein